MNRHFEIIKILTFDFELNNLVPTRRSNMAHASIGRWLPSASSSVASGSGRGKQWLLAQDLGLRRAGRQLLSLDLGDEIVAGVLPVWIC